MPTNTDYRKYADTVLEQGKAAFDEARKPLLAWVGATDLAYDRLRSQLKELPARAQAREQYATLSHRGELVVRRLRRRPEVRSAFGRTEKLLSRTEKLVEEAEEQVTGKPASGASTGSTTSSSSAARKAPARKAPARKSPATRA